MAFKTQYQFRLPRGYVDEDGNIHRDGVMRLATARDEILPLQDYRVQSNRAYLVIVLLSRVVTKLGDHTHVTVDMIENLFIHIRAIRTVSLRQDNRAARSIAEHMQIIDALEARDPDLAERLVRDHTLGLANHVEKHGVFAE